jgi:hypothetical protein
MVEAAPRHALRCARAGDLRGVDVLQQQGVLAADLELQRWHLQPETAEHVGFAVIVARPYVQVVAVEQERRAFLAGRRHRRILRRESSGQDGHAGRQRHATTFHRGTSVSCWRMRRFAPRRDNVS